MGKWMKMPYYSHRVWLSYNRPLVIEKITDMETLDYYYRVIELSSATVYGKSKNLEEVFAVAQSISYNPTLANIFGKGKPSETFDYVEEKNDESARVQPHSVDYEKRVAPHFKDRYRK